MSHVGHSRVYTQDSVNECTQIEALRNKIAELSFVVKKLASSKTFDGSSTTLRTEVTSSF